MALDIAKHFDAPQAPSALRTSLGLVAAHKGPFVAMVVATTIVLVAAVGIVAAAALVRADGAAAIRAAGVVVLVDPQATAADAEAVGALVRSIPGVAEASFRSRDDALKGLAARGMPAPDGRNPLPDAWTLRVAATGDTGPLPGERLATVARAAAALPHVSGTRVDERWIAQLDRDEQGRRRSIDPARSAALATLCVLLLCVGLLGGASVWSAPDEPRKSVLALVALSVAAAAAAVAGVALVALPAAANVLSPDGVQPIARAIAALPPTAASAALFAGLVAGAALSLAVGAIVGARRVDRNSGFVARLSEH